MRSRRSIACPTSASTCGRSRGIVPVYRVSRPPMLDDVLAGASRCGKVARRARGRARRGGPGWGRPTGRPRRSISAAELERLQAAADAIARLEHHERGAAALHSARRRDPRARRRRRHVGLQRARGLAISSPSGMSRPYRGRLPRDCAGSRRWANHSDQALGNPSYMERRDGRRARRRRLARAGEQARSRERRLYGIVRWEPCSA